MKRIFAKLARSAGETLVESLASILIITLSVSALGGMVVAAVRINSRAKAMSESFYSELSAAERCEGTREGEIYFSGVGQSADVYFTGGDGELTAYRVRGD